MDFNEWLATCGIDPPSVTADQLPSFQQMWRSAMHAPPHTSAQNVPSGMITGVADFDLEGMVASAAYENPDQRAALEGVGRYAADHGWNQQQTQLALLRAGRGHARGLHIPSDDRSGPQQADAIAISLAMSCGARERDVRGWADDRTMDLAMSRPVRGMTLHGVIRACLRSAGAHVPMGAITDSHIREAFHISRHADGPSMSGPSTISVSGILSNLANKSMMRDYQTTPVTWSKWCHVQSAKDFKSMTQYRMTLKGELIEVPAGGKLEHMSLEDASETNRVKTYGGLLALDRTHIINDDLGAFASVPPKMAREAAIGLEEAVYVKLLANAGSFFSVGNGNIKTGGGSVLALAGLADAAATFAAQLDSNGRPIFLTPRVLLVPPILGPAARTLMSSSTIVDGTASAAQPDGNAFKGLYEPCESPFLGTAAGLDGSSQTGWYLMAEASEFSPIAVAFLHGQNVPTVETGELDFATLGIAFRVIFDFGVAQHDHRGGVFSAGA